MLETPERLLQQVKEYVEKVEKENDELKYKLGREMEAHWAVADSLRRYTDKELDSADLQLVCLALALLVLHRPGMDYAVGLVAEKLGGVVAERHITQFKQTSADLCKPYDLLHRSPAPQDDPTSGEQGGG